MPCKNNPLFSRLAIANKSRTSTTSTTTVAVTSSVCGGGSQKRGESHDLENLSVEDIEKRTNVLPLLAAFAAAKISEGCSCLNLKPTATKIATFTAPAPVRFVSRQRSSQPNTSQTVNVVATATSCVVAQPPPPVCKNSGVQASCNQGSECCSGRCENNFGMRACCNAINAPCDLQDPGACCSGICYGSGDGRTGHCG